jgi:hypothetical protein
MDQTVLRKHLGKAESYVGGGQRRLSRQRRIVSNLERGGRDSRSPRDLLRLFENILAVYLPQRDRLRDQLRP